MAKKRQTRRQKMIAATRRISLANTIEIPHPVSLEQVIPDTKVNVPYSRSYSYVRRDAGKTFITLALIAVLNIAFYFILKLRVVSLFGLVF